LRAINARPPVWRSAACDPPARRPDRCHRFRRQHPVGRYFADFACDRLRLILEIDGSVHDRDDVMLRDHLRQTELEALGWTVLRFTNDEALTHPERIVAAIREHARRLGM
jgi:very-short-patch-repair endonuclease